MWESEIDVVGRPVLAADRRRRAGVGSMLGRLAGKGEERLRRSRPTPWALQVS